MSDELAEIQNEFLVEAQEMLELLDQRFVTLESEPGNTELLNEIFRAMHSMKGSAGFLGFTRLVDVTHRAESILNQLRQGDMTVTQHVITVILEAVDAIKLIMADIRESGTDQHVPTEGVTHKLDAVLAGRPHAADAPLGAPAPGAPAREEAPAAGPCPEPVGPARPAAGRRARRARRWPGP
ncbi:Hpt domain-containing protein [Nitrospira sp. Kam-Ns4a]